MSFHRCTEGSAHPEGTLESDEKGLCCRGLASCGCLREGVNR